MQQMLFLLQAGNEPLISGIEAMQKISLKLLFRLLIDLAAVIVLIRLVYFPVYKKSDLHFTFFVFNIVIFLICFLLNKVDLSMGAAFGLFAVFSMLRYRTEEISMKDMTYLFLLIAMGLVSAVTKIKDAGDAYEYLFIAIIHLAIILVAFLLESKLLITTENVQTINYENIELLHADRRLALMEDLRTRTGLDIRRITVNKIDFVNDTAQIRIYYIEAKNSISGGKTSSKL